MFLLYARQILRHCDILRQNQRRGTMRSAARSLNTHWIDIQGASRNIARIPDFLDNKSKNILASLKIFYAPQPSSHHNELGVVEQKILTIRLIIQQIIVDV